MPRRLTANPEPLLMINLGIWLNGSGLSLIIGERDWIVGNRAGFLRLGLPDRPLIPVVMGPKILLYRKGLDSEKRISSLGPIVDALPPPMLFVSSCSPFLCCNATIISYFR